MIARPQQFLIHQLGKPISWTLGLVATGILSISAATYLISDRQSPKVDIAAMTVPVQSKNLAVQISATGSVVPLQTVNISPKTAGRLAELYVEQGERVEQGQAIARMDNADIQAQLLQAQARLSEVRAGTRPEEKAQAQARLAQAQARLSEARAGTRPEEKAQAQAQVESAQAQVNLTTAQVERYRYLVQEGAESRHRLDEVVTEDRQARASLKEAQAKLDLQSGARPEEIARIEAEVAEARLALEQLQNGARPEEIAQAQAEVAAALGERQAVEVQQEDTVIRAPFSGIVMQKYATVGAFVTPTTSASSTTSATSTSIIAIAEGLEILAEVPESDLGQIELGQTVEIVADAYPEQVFKGRVRLIAPEAVVDQNVTSFQVRVALESQTKLRSGMNVGVTFLGESLNNALVVPTVAIATEKGQTGVFVLAENKPQFRAVTLGPTLENQTQIIEGVKRGERVLIDLPENRKPNEQGTNETG